MYNTTNQCLSGRVPLDVREACRDMLFYLRKRPELIKKPSPKGFKVYDNREGFLPKITRKESWCYYEAVVGNARDGSTGKRRVVLLVEGNGDQFKRCLGRYYSNTHYGGSRPGDIPFIRVN